MAIDPSELAGRWVHSHEEDSPGRLVLRRPGADRPPARGRRSIEIAPGGVFVDRRPGPVDVPVAATGSWSLEGDRLTLTGPDGPLTFEVVSVDEERLVLAE